VDRRELLREVGAVLALALGGGGLVGCATTGGRSRGSVAPGAWLGEVDRVGTRLRNLELPAELRRHMARLRLSPALFGDTFCALHGVAAFRDLPPGLQRDPDIQGRLRRDGEVLGRSLVELTAYLERLTPQDRADRARLLAGEPGLLASLRTAITEEGQASGTAPERLGRVLEMLDHITWRLTHQAPDLLIDTCIEQIDRAAEHVGLERRGAAVTPVPDWQPAGRPGEPPPTAALSQREQTRVVGEVIKHIGQIICLFGLLCGGVAAGSVLVVGWAYSALGFTLAAFVAILGLVLTLVGAFMNNP